VITCQECGKMNGSGQIGTSWICEDCKVEQTNSREQSDPEHAPAPASDDTAQ